MRLPWSSMLLGAVLGMLVSCGRQAPAPLSPEQADDTGAALSSGARYLLEHQGSDGAWRSDVYGHFRSGDALTPLVLSALVEAPASSDVETACRRGTAYLSSLAARDKEGAIELSYPVYTLALGVRVLSRPEYAEHQAVRKAWLTQLLRLQHNEEGGWHPADEEYGGWGYADDVPRRPKPGEAASSLAEANLSATVHAVEALRAAGVSTQDPALARALTFVRRCQNYKERRTPEADHGGFFFLHHDALRNKAGSADSGLGKYFHSYGSTTADGLRALLGCGLGSDAPETRAAVAWLEHHFSASEHPGRFGPGFEANREGLYFYYAASAARALSAARVRILQAPSGEVHWPEELARELARRQQGDGSWSNPVPTMRENDPVLATAQAVLALSLCRKAKAQ